MSLTSALQKCFWSSVDFYSCSVSRQATEQAVVPPACKQDHLKAAKSRVVWRLLSTLPQPSFIVPNIPPAAGKSINVLRLPLSQPGGCVSPTCHCWRSKVSRSCVTDGSVHMGLCSPGNSPLQEMQFQCIEAALLDFPAIHALQPPTPGAEGTGAV